MGLTEHTTAKYTTSSQDQFAKECNCMRLNNQVLHAIVLCALLLDLLSEAIFSYVYGYKMRKPNADSAHWKLIEVIPLIQKQWIFLCRYKLNRTTQSLIVFLTNSEIRCKADIGETSDTMASRSDHWLVPFHGRRAMKTPHCA